MDERRIAIENVVRWLRRQLAQPTPFREHLEAAVANDDPEEFRRLLAASPFSEGQRRVVEDLLQRWSRSSG